MAPQLSAQPAPCGSLAHLSDHVPGRQAQLTLLLRTVSGQDQHLCGRSAAQKGPVKAAWPWRKSGLRVGESRVVGEVFVAISTRLCRGPTPNLPHIPIASGTPSRAGQGG